VAAQSDMGGRSEFFGPGATRRKTGDDRTLIAQTVASARIVCEELRHRVANV